MKIKGKGIRTLQRRYRKLLLTNPVKAGHIRNYLNKLWGINKYKLWDINK